MISQDQQIALYRMYEDAKKERDRRSSIYELIALYIMGVSVTGDTMDQNLLETQIYDMTALHALETMVAAMAGALWPSAEQSLVIERHPFFKKVQSRELDDFITVMNETQKAVMDDPEAGFMVMVEEYLYDQGGYGISTLNAVESTDPDRPLDYIASSIIHSAVLENDSGVIDTYFNKSERTAAQLIERYGDNITEPIRRNIEENEMSKKHEVLRMIMPVSTVPGPNPLADHPEFKFISFHFDFKEKKAMDILGYERLPSYTVRFRKNAGNPYGIGSGMVALAAILDANDLSEKAGLLEDYIADPAHLFYGDSTVGNEEVDKSPGASLMWSPTGRAQGPGSRAFDFLHNGGDLNPLYTRLITLEEKINQAFMVDRLLDFNTKTEMTLGEAQIRDEKTDRVLRTVFTRQNKEAFLPICRYTQWYLLKNEGFGVIEGSDAHLEALDGEAGININVIPISLLEQMGLDDPNDIDAFTEQVMRITRIRFNSPAARAAERDIVRGIAASVEFMGASVDLDQGVIDVVKMDEATRQVAESSGVPPELIRNNTEIEERRKERQQQEQVALELEAQKVASEANRNNAQAEAQATRSA